METLPAILIIVIALTLYFLPALIANHRKHHAENGITFLNLILGWTGIIWVVCFIWAFTSEKNNE
jgi:amino acid transporter